MKNPFGIGLRIYLIIFLVGKILLASYIYNIKFGKSQLDCSPSLAINSGFLESPIFDFGENKKNTLTKFIWKGYLDPGSYIQFSLFYGQTIGDFTKISFSVPPSKIYNFDDLDQKPQNVRYVKYRIDFYKCEEDAIPRVDRIFIYYSK